MPGHSKKAPPARRKPANRTTERIELNLSPADAAAIRIAAEMLEMTNSAYVARLVAVAGDPMKLAREQDHFVDASRLAGALHNLLNQVRGSRAEFGRAGGLVKSFFVRDDASQVVAEGYTRELSEALREFTDAGKRVENALEELSDKLAPLFSDLEFAVRRLSGR